MDRANLLRLKESLPESFNSYQATVAMLSILLGFVFAALLTLLSGTANISVAVIWALLTTMLSLMTALLCFHLTLHQVFRFWGIFFPESWTRRMGSAANSIGVLGMFSTVSFLLHGRGFRRSAIVVISYGIALLLFVLGMHVRLLTNGLHVLWVDWGARSPQDTLAPTSDPES